MPDAPARRGRLIVFAKYPRPGRVKTRLVPPLTVEEAAGLYTAMLCDSMASYTALPEIEPILFVADPADVEPIRGLLREHKAISWSDPLRVYPQEGDDLGERLRNAFDLTFDAVEGPAAAIGTDHPSLPVEYIRHMFERLNDHDLVLGPAEDGGYYAIGLRGPQPALFRDMPWSTPELFRHTLEAAYRLGLRTHVLPVWYDVDDEPTLRKLIDDSERGLTGPRVRAELAGIEEALWARRGENG